jgi:hypothetical protein
MLLMDCNSSMTARTIRAGRSASSEIHHAETQMSFDVSRHELFTRARHIANWQSPRTIAMVVTGP